MPEIDHTVRAVGVDRGSRGDAGASLVEYAVLLALIVVVCIVAVTFLGGATGDSLSRSTSRITEAGP